MKALILMGLAAGLAVSLATAADATPTLVGTTSDPTGINGLLVDGTTYNVTFSQTSFNSTFTAGTTASEHAASALTDALNTLGVTGLDGFTFPGDPDGGPFYLLSVEDDTQLGADTATLTFGASWVFVTGNGAPNLGVNKGDIDNEAANFVAVNSTAVPEPLTLSLFGAGLIGAAAMRRRKAKALG